MGGTFIYYKWIEKDPLYQFCCPGDVLFSSIINRSSCIIKAFPVGHSMLMYPEIQIMLDKTESKMKEKYRD